MTNCTIGDYLVLRLRQIDIKHILVSLETTIWNFSTLLSISLALSWLQPATNSTQPALMVMVINGIYALVTTFGVGELQCH